MNKLDAQVGLIHGADFTVQDGVPHMSPATRANAETGLRLLETGRIERVICSGRGPLDGVEYPVSEAKLMADYLMQAGIKPRYIETEEQSSTTVGNWAYSAEILQQLGAETVCGVTAAPNIMRMQAIGRFVARRADFVVTGYEPSDAPVATKDYVREAGVGLMTGIFLGMNRHTPLSELEPAYIEFKNRTGMNRVKRTRRRTSTPA